LPKVTNRRWNGAAPGCRISRTLRPVSSGVIVPDSSEVIPNYSFRAMSLHPLRLSLTLARLNERDTIEWGAVLIACRNAVGDWWINNWEMSAPSLDFPELGRPLARRQGQRTRSESVLAISQ
jgi:hypothetical protein